MSICGRRFVQCIRAGSAGSESRNVGRSERCHIEAPTRAMFVARRYEQFRRETTHWHAPLALPLTCAVLIKSPLLRASSPNGTVWTITFSSNRTELNAPLIAPLLSPLSAPLSTLLSPPPLDRRSASPTRSATDSERLWGEPSCKTPGRVGSKEAMAVAVAVAAVRVVASEPPDPIVSKATARSVERPVEAVELTVELAELTAGEP